MCALWCSSSSVFEYAAAAAASLFPHHRAAAYRIVGIPERARPNSSEVDTRPRVASRCSSRPRRAPPTGGGGGGDCCRRLRRMGNRKTNPLGQIPVPGFCTRARVTSVSSRGSRALSLSGIRRRYCRRSFPIRFAPVPPRSVSAVLRVYARRALHVRPGRALSHRRSFLLTLGVPFPSCHRTMAFHYCCDTWPPLCDYSSYYDDQLDIKFYRDSDGRVYYFYVRRPTRIMYDKRFLPSVRYTPVSPPPTNYP